MPSPKTQREALDNSICGPAHSSRDRRSPTRQPQPRHGRIAESISRAIGRPVRMSSIKLRLLPRPGFEIADFVVEEDPAFGAEPILRSSQVIASVRLLPLWRGRLEIARIAFDEPSV